jgi:hypothetical protein
MMTKLTQLIDDTPARHSVHVERSSNMIHDAKYGYKTAGLGLAETPAISTITGAFASATKLGHCIHVLPAYTLQLRRLAVSTSSLPHSSHHHTAQHALGHATCTASALQPRAMFGCSKQRSHVHPTPPHPTTHQLPGAHPSTCSKQTLACAPVAAASTQPAAYAVTSLNLGLLPYRYSSKRLTSPMEP